MRANPKESHLSGGWILALMESPAALGRCYYTPGLARACRVSSGDIISIKECFPVAFVVSPQAIDSQCVESKPARHKRLQCRPRFQLLCRSNAGWVVSRRARG